MPWRIAKIADGGSYRVSVPPRPSLSLLALWRHDVLLRPPTALEQTSLGLKRVLDLYVTLLVCSFCALKHDHSNNTYQRARVNNYKKTQLLYNSPRQALKQVDTSGLSFQMRSTCSTGFYPDSTPCLGCSKVSWRESVPGSSHRGSEDQSAACLPQIPGPAHPGRL